MTPRSCLKWKSTGKIFKTVGLRWVPTGKILTSNTTKVDSEPPNGSNEDIINPYEYEKTLDVSAGTLNLSAVQASVLNVNKWRLLTTLQAQFLKRKEKCMIQCALSSKEEKSSCILFIMADANICAPEALVAADFPPTRSDEQILPRDKWVPVGKSNCFLNVERTQANPIFKIAVDILKNTNFFRAFTASSIIPSIYIQQFWDTIRFDKDKGYSYQLDEQRFYLTKATLRDALQLSSNNINFTPPPNSNTIISFVNNLGYLNVVRTLSGVVTNDMYQPWRALATIINLCLTGMTSGFERPRAPVLQILWGDKMNLALHAEGKKKVNPLVISGVRFTKLIINHLQSKHKFHKRPDSPLHLPTEESALGYLKFSFKNTKRVRFGMAISDTLISKEIRTAIYYSEYVAKVTKYQRYLAGEAVSDDDAPAPKPAKGATTKSTRKPKPQSSKTAPVGKPAASKTSKSSASQPSKPTPAPAKPHTPQLVDEFVDEGVPNKEPMHVFREPDTGKIQPLLEVEGKGKEKVGEEQAAQVLLNLQTPKKKNPVEQFNFQRRTPATTEPSGLVKSLSLYAELGLTDSEMDSDEEVSPDMNAQGQEEGQGGTNPGDAGVSQTPSSHVVYAGPNLDHMDLGIDEASSQPNTEQMDDEFTSTAYPKVQENLKLPTKGDVRLKEPASSAGTLSSMKNLNKEFLVEKSQEDELEKTNTEVEVQSMVTVPIH
ncbi:hypothetical protein Tco_0211353 [Tanacetum coccineum]